MENTPAGMYGRTRAHPAGIGQRAQPPVPHEIPPKDVSRWLNTGNRTTSGVIGFPKYETMSILADFFGVDVGYLTGETDERSFDMAHACEYIGLNHNAIQAIREWIGTGGDGQNANTGESSMREYRAQTLNDMLSSSTFAVLASKLLTLHEMSVIWRTNPSRFDSLMSSLASESDLPNTLTFQLVTEAFYGMANESFSALLRDAYPAPTERQFTQIQD